MTERVQDPRAHRRTESTVRLINRMLDGGWQVASLKGDASADGTQEFHIKWEKPR